jgi:hypothetical protein
VRKLPGIAKKAFFQSEHVPNFYARESLPCSEAYLQKPPEPDKPHEMSEKVLETEGKALPVA